ncbi:MAG: hypothetical protein GY859_05125 [Desulfobacterales bacterium]|nr:hypothetical protein [Desulfobacterales bacterium]
MTVANIEAGIRYAPGSICEGGTPLLFHGVIQSDAAIQIRKHTFSNNVFEAPGRLLDTPDVEFDALAVE